MSTTVLGTETAAARWISAHGMPTTRDEAWHYSPLGEIDTALDASVPAAHRQLTATVVDELSGRHGATRLVFVNGFFDADASDIEAVDGLWCGSGDERPDSRTTTDTNSETDTFVDGFHALNAAQNTSGAVVIVDAGVTLTDPIHIANITAPGSSSEICHPRARVVVGDSASVSLIETFASLPGAGFTNASTDIRIGVGATVAHDRISNDDGEMIHIGITTVEQAADSQLHATSVMLGGRIARHAFDVTLQGDGATSTVDGLYLPSGRQRHDTMVKIDHAASHCSSTQHFSGVVDDRARGSFSGHIIVRPGTVGTDAHQSNRNLLLRPTAQADARPWLEILADDVRCTHGATVGRLDAEALFYLRSRGVPAATARAMLVEAFVHEIIDPITPSSLGEMVARLVSTHSAGTSQ